MGDIFEKIPNSNIQESIERLSRASTIVYGQAQMQLVNPRVTFLPSGMGTSRGIEVTQSRRETAAASLPIDSHGVKHRS